MPEKTVVIAEDEPRIARSLAFIVEREGAEAVTVTDGNAAVDAIRRHRPALALVDIMMPGLDGLEVIRQVRADPDCRTAILVVTAVGQQDDETTALNLGATGYVRKPFDARQLRDLIVEILRVRG